MSKTDSYSPRVLIFLLYVLMAGAAGAEVIISEDSEWRYYKGVTEASTPVSAWRLADYNDAGWPLGRGPFYYEDGAGFSGNTALTDMRGGYTCVYLRKAFTVVDPAGVGELTLYLQSDDGCVVWLNGNPVARVNMATGEPLYTWTSLPAAGEPNMETIVLTNPAPLLRAGLNVLAVQAFNSSLSDSTDFLMSASLSGSLDNQPPGVESVVPAGGSRLRTLESIEVVFTENVTGVDAADLRVNGAPTTGLKVISPRNYSFTFPNPGAGTVSVSFAPNHGIVDLATPANPLVPATWTYDLDPSAPLAEVIISEFLADNENGPRDNFGNRSDWIELYNRSDFPAELGGYFLTDDPARPTKWRFPPVTLDRGQFLVVWASEQDQVNPLAPLHTNFRLSAGGEYLALFDPTTNVVSEFAPSYPPQQADISYGRDQTSPSLMGYYSTPTPGAANSSMGSGFAPGVVFSIAGGVYTNASVSVSLSAPSGVIRYTTDGSRPTTTSTVYSGPIEISRSLVIHARVFQTGLLPSAIGVQTYTLLGSSAASFNSNLPFFILNTSGRGVSQDTRTPATITVVEPFRGRASMSTRPAFQGNCQMEVRGQSSTGFPKLAYNLELNDPNGNDQDEALLGLPSEADWVLYNPYSDKPFLQNFLAFELHEKMGNYAPRRRFVEVFVDSNSGKLEYPGDYRGIYILLEKIKVDPHRVDIARLSNTQNTEPEITGGYIVKKDKDSPGDYNFSTQGGAGFGAQALKLHEPKPREATLPQKAWIRNYLIQFEKALYAANWQTATGTNHYSHYIDVDAFVDNHWIVEFPKQIDGYRLSNYMRKDRNGKLRMDPIWDWNLSFGNADYLEGQNSSGWYYPLLTENDHIWLRRLICGTTSGSGTTGDPDFNQKIADRWSVLRTNIFSSTNVLQRIDELAGYLDEAQVRDFAKWPRLGMYVWPNPPLYSTPTTYAGIISNMKNWVRNRYVWIDNQFLKSPGLSHPGGGVSPGFTLTMSAPAGSVYYTTDGSDPRASGGAIASGAKLYAAPGLLIQTNARVVARARSGTRWSGPTAATFTVQLPTLALTELMYSPAPTPGAATNDAARFEFLELLNTGATGLDLRGFRFTDGIEYSFATGAVTWIAAGERVVLAREPAALASRYPGIAKVTGPYVGALANEGERLKLVGPNEEVVLDLAYEAWHPTTDGLGFALVPREEGQGFTSEADSTSWRVGSVLGGTPGLPEPPAPGFPQVLINEILTHVDPPLTPAIELVNLGAEEADLGGWFLSDDRETPKYVIPPGTRLAPGACYVRTEADFNPHPGVPPSFRLNPAGEEVCLFSADSLGRLTGYAQVESFDASLKGVSFGRHGISTGEEHFVAQAARTLGQTNGPPQVGPVVITEVQYRPPDVFANKGYWDNTEDEYIELSNVSGTTVSLFDTGAPTNTWGLRDAVDYRFPPAQTMNPGTRLLVVSFDPVADAASAAAFRTRYGLGAGVRLFGPYSGKLANSRDSVELVRPTTITTSSGAVVTADVLADKVHYRDESPWPAGCDGLGFSLQRRVENAYGDDPANWMAAAPTPAAPVGPGTEPTIVSHPGSQTVLPESSVVFEVTATGDGPLQYQWRFNGENLLGATSASLTITNVQGVQAGRYEVVVSNNSRAVTSLGAWLKVGIPPVIVQGPRAATTAPGEAVAFSVIAHSGTPLSYRWRRDGAVLAGEVGATLRLPDVDASHEGSYDVVISDTAGFVSTSSSAGLVMLGKPIITQHPAGLTVTPGAMATFEVTVTNNAAMPVGYTWFRDGVAVAAHLVDSPTDRLVLDSVQSADAGDFWVTVTNRALLAPGETSERARLTVEQAVDSDGDGMPDAWELAHGLNPGDPSDATADADRDGASNGEEYIAGTDPRDGTSVLRVDRVEVSGAATIRFWGFKNRSYSLLFRDQLGLGEWQVLTQIPAIPDAADELRLVEVVDPEPPVLPGRFYRLQTPAAQGL